MAIESLAFTRAQKFLEDGSHEAILGVLEGVEVESAVTLASCLEHGVQALLGDAVAEGTMDADVAYLGRFALQTAKALRIAAGQEV